MDSKLLQQRVYEEINTQIFHSGLDWIERCCDALIFMLRKYSASPVKIVINEDPQTGTRYDSAYIDTKNGNTEIFIGMGLIINAAKGIADFDSEKIKILLSNYSKNYNEEKHYALAINCIFISSLFIFINHEFSHNILKHSRQSNQETSMNQEICADCIAGQLMESIYNALIENIVTLNYDIANITHAVDALFTIGMTYGAWKIESKYPHGTSKSHPDIKIRTVLLVGSFIVAVGDKKSRGRMLNNFGYLYKTLYNMDVEDFDKFFHQHIGLCYHCYEQLYEIIAPQNNKVIPPSTPTT